MKFYWNEIHGSILLDFFAGLNKRNIRWFIIRGFEGLPNNNPSKDVDVMVEVGKGKEAEKILIASYKRAGLTNLHSDTFGHIHCYVGMNIEQRVSIHIDLVEGYISKGYEVLTFDELYKHVINYNGMNVLDPFMNGVMLIVYKIFAYNKTKLKDAYQTEIYDIYKKHPEQLYSLLEKMTNPSLANEMCNHINKKDFDGLVNHEPEFTKALKKYTFRKRPLKTIYYICEFLMQKIIRIIFKYKSYAKTFAVVAPDGAGKTTFLDNLLSDLSFFYVQRIEDGRFHVYHFRPSILPNLGAVGEKTGVMQQDKNFTSPHRAKVSNPLSSLFRISYYTLDYIIGWNKCVRNDVHYDRYSVFDRYSYDFIVDPRRIRIGLPRKIREFFVSLTPKPDLVFYLDASPETIFSRKQELTYDEIKNQISIYRELSKKDKKRFIVLDAEKKPEDLSDEATKIILERYTEKL